MKKMIFMVLGIVLAAPGPGYAATFDITTLTSLDLETAQRIALADNPSLAAASERVQQARQRLEQARALYFPSLDLDGGATWGRISETTALSQSRQGSVQLDRDQEHYRLSLAASWLIFDGFARKFTNLIAEYGSKESKQARLDGQRVLLQLVAESYYSAHLAQYNTRIAEADIAFNGQQLKEAEIRREQGAGSLSNVLNFRVQINKAKTQLLIAGRDYEVALYSLAVLLGIEDAQLPENLQLKELRMLEKREFKSIGPEALLSAALKYRPDLLKQQYKMERSEAEIGRAQAPLYPTLGLGGSVNGDSSEDVYLEEDDFGTTIGLSFTYNLYRGGGDEARIAESRAAKREAARLFQEQRNQISKEVRRAYTNLVLAQEQLILQRSTTELVTQTRDLVRDGYNAGQESLVRLNEAQRDLVRTQSNLALALVGLYSLRHNLLTVTGESLLPFANGSGQE